MHRWMSFASACCAAGCVAGAAQAATYDFTFSISYSGQSITGRLVGLTLDANGNATEVDPTSVLITSAPASVQLPASPSDPYVLVPHTFERSTLFDGTFISTVPGVYGFQVTNYAIVPSLQNLVMIEASGDVTLVFNFGASVCYQCGDATYGIMAEEDALWPAINTSVSFAIVWPGDLNNDAHMNGADLAVLLGAWGTGNAAADLTHDGTVNGADLAVLLGSWTS